MVARSSPDIDHGWAYVVMFSSCCAQVLTLGFGYSSAVFYTKFLDEFEDSPVFTAWTANINAAILLVSGELVTALVGCFGTRPTIILGCILSTIGFLACYFAQHLATVFMFFGILGGLGNACCYYPIFAVVSSYFQRYRALAFAFGSCGAGIGQFMYPALVRMSCNVYTFRGVFLILAGLNLHGLVIAAAMMPPREMETQTKRCGAALRRQWRQQVHNFKLLRHARWALYLLSSILCSLGSGCFLTHISNVARVLGYSDDQALFLPSIVGIAGLVGRLTMGSAVKLDCVHVGGLSLVLYACFGAANLLIVTGTSYALLVTACVVCGFGAAVYGICPEFTAHVLGTSYITAGVSYNCLSCAVAFVIGGPLAAALYEVDPSYRLSFATVGTISFLGAFLNLGSWCYIEDRKLHFVPSVESNAENGPVDNEEKRLYGEECRRDTRLLPDGVALIPAMGE